MWKLVSLSCYVAGDGADAEQPVPAAAGQPQQDRHRPDELEHHGAAQQEAATQVQYSTVQYNTVQYSQPVQPYNLKKTSYGQSHDETVRQ